MRLIDADELKREDLCDFCNSADCANCFSDKAFEQWIASQPTAYDPDKVVEEVREVADRIHNYCEEIDWHIPEEERTGYEMLPDIWKLSEIVKKGGAV